MEQKLCLVTKYGVVGSFRAKSETEHEFKMMELTRYKSAVKLALRLTNVSKEPHFVALYDERTGAILRSDKLDKMIVAKQNSPRVSYHRKERFLFN